MAVAHDIPAALFVKAVRKCLPYIGRPDRPEAELNNLRIQVADTRVRVIAMDGFRAIDYSFTWKRPEGQGDMDVLMPPQIARAIMAIIGPGKIHRSVYLTIVDADYLNGNDVVVQLGGQEVRYKRIEIERPHYTLDDLIPAETTFIAHVSAPYFADILQGAPKDGISLHRKQGMEKETQQPLIVVWTGDGDDEKVRQMLMPMAAVRVITDAAPE